MIIDAHIHMGGDPERRGSPEELLKLMEDNGISKGVVFPAPGLLPDNREMAKLIKPYPDKFVGFAWVNPHAGKDAADELEEMVVKYGFKGVKLQPLLHAYAANSKIVDPVMEKAAELNIPVLIHSGQAPFSLPWLITELAERHPAVKIIMDHMGFHLGFYVDAAIAGAQKCSNIILGTTSMPYFRKINQAVKLIGPERVIFGSDAPTVHPAPEIARVKAAGLAPEEEKLVLGGNILRILDEAL